MYINRIIFAPHIHVHVFDTYMYLHTIHLDTCMCVYMYGVHILVRVHDNHAAETKKTKSNVFPSGASIAALFVLQVYW